jgi:hypothetical protein
MNGLSREDFDEETFDFVKEADPNNVNYIDTELDTDLDSTSVPDPMESFLSRAECCVLLWDMLGCASDDGGDKVLEHSALSFNDGQMSAQVVNHLQFCSQLGLINLYEPQQGKQESILLRPRIDAVQAEVYEEHPLRDEEVLQVAHRWVKAMIADFSVCPYTLDDESAGKPKGGIRYSVSDARTVEEAFRDFWAEVYTILSAPEVDISTSLVWFPGPLFSNVEFFESFCAALDDALPNSSLQFEDQVQLVYFHPEFKFKDKDAQVYFIFDDDGNVMGLSSEVVEPINFARRSPWPMVNLLRTPRVKELQKSVPEGKVFAENKERLNAIGTPVLQKMLDQRNWDQLPPHSVKAKLRLQKQRE